MVGSALAIRSNIALPAVMQLSSLSRRSLSTRAQSQVLQAVRPLRSGNPHRTLQRSARRSYADAPPAPKPKKRAGFFRWLWRLTLLSGAGLTGALAYSIYQLRYPVEQFEPDPSKKTLVILGKRLALSWPCPRRVWRFTVSDSIDIQGPDGVLSPF